MVKGESLGRLSDGCGVNVEMSRKLTVGSRQTHEIIDL